MTREEMKSRTKEYANRIVRVCAALPNNWVAQTLGKQLLRSGTSVGANYRAVCRAKSNPDFINKLRIVEEECDESLFWMELLVDNNLIKLSRLGGLMKFWPSSSLRRKPREHPMDASIVNRKS
jgi:four helix bundle protein